MIAQVEERGILVMRNGVVGNNTNRPLVHGGVPWLRNRR